LAGLPRRAALFRFLARCAGGRSFRRFGARRSRRHDRCHATPGAPCMANPLAESACRRRGLFRRDRRAQVGAAVHRPARRWLERAQRVRRGTRLRAETVCMKIIDAHHHIWRQADLPWLLGPTQPRIFGAYDAIKRDYPIEEYLEDIAGSGVEKSVYVQANWAPNWAGAEDAWVQETADRTGWPHAIVGYCDMTVADARPALDRLAQDPLMRGIRQQHH